jgi:hypothetical protein
MWGRSGHRMVVWRNYLVLFGGFYEAMRDVRWYNDLFLFSFQDERWTQIQYRPHAQVLLKLCYHPAKLTNYLGTQTSQRGTNVCSRQ